MKKKVTPRLILLLAVVIVTAFSFFACDGADDAYVIPSDREVKSITVYSSAAGTYTVIDGTNLDAVVKELRAVPALSYSSSSEDVTSASSDRFDFTLSVTLEKSGIKREKTYNVYIGVFSFSTILPSDNTRTSAGKTEIRIEGYVGECSAGLIVLLEQLTGTEL